MRKTIMSLCAILLSMSAYAQELYTQDNAASIDSESDSTTGWNAQSTLMTSDSSNPQHGTYSLKIEATTTSGSSGTRSVLYGFTAVNGTTYDISIWGREGAQSNDPAFANWTGVSGFSTTEIIGTTWSEYTFTVTATSTSPEIRVYTGSSGNNVIGDYVFIDRISITPQGSADTQAPTAPTLSSTAQTDTTVDLSWTGATDDTGVTGYKIFKDNNLEATLGDVSSYQMTGLTASTIYSFAAKAIDAAGNESLASNVSVTTDASGGSSGGGGTWTETSGNISYTTGNVGIGTNTIPTDYRLAVSGKIISEELKVQLQATWPDYVFDEGYDLPSLKEIQKYIAQNGHLPNIPTAKEVTEHGIEVGEMNRLLLEKIEELTLYTLQQQKEITELKTQVNQLKTNR
ncbi:fibronectin type III domain-containing protein [Allomuricauda sp. R78024]|uniref:fibronectin type III domain-containing protein n=1 Tax=Allomuricauda sp. R78024 TaxID=3093867 RepID=UPI0037CB4CDE